MLLELSQSENLIDFNTNLRQNAKNGFEKDRLF